MGMNLTSATDYAMRAMIHIACLPENSVVLRSQIAEAQGIPSSFMAKILRRLVQARLLASSRGVNGGFSLARPSSEITMLDVVEAVIGEIFLNDCVIRPESCQRAPACSAHQVWEKARDQLRNTLRQTNFKQMLEDESCRTDRLITPRQ